MVAGIVFAMTLGAMAQSTNDVQLELVLKDNGLLRGRPVKSTLKARLEMIDTPVELKLAKISHLEHKSDKTGFLVTFTNDDTISCRILEPNIEIVTLLGKLTISPADIRAIRNVGGSTKKWKAVPNPRPRYGGYNEQMDMAADKGGVMWVMSRYGLTRFEGGGRRNIGFSTGFNLAMIFGAPDRGLYVTQFDTSRNKGLLHRITDNGHRAKPLTEYRLNSIYQVPCLHVASTRKIYNWGESFVRVFTLRPGSGQALGEWKEWEAKLTRQETRVLEVDGRMHFFCNNRVWTVDADDNFSTNKVKLTTKVMKAGKGKKTRNPPLVLARWDKRNIVSFSPGDSSIQANDIDRFTPVDVDRINGRLKEYRLHAVFGSRGGSVYFCATRRADGENMLVRLTRDGTVMPLPETGLFLGGSTTVSNVYESPHGALWLAAGNRGVARYRKRNVTVFGPESGLPGGRYFQLAADSDGNIWTLSRSSPYVLQAAGRNNG